MNTPITIQDLFKLILFLLGIGALGYLIVVLKNLANLFKKVNLLVEQNDENIDFTIKELVEISENINSITKHTDEAMKSMVPEVDELICHINSISGKVESIADSIDDTTYKLTETVDSVSDSIGDSAFAFKQNINSISDYVQIITEIIEVIKNLIKKR